MKKRALNYKYKKYFCIVLFFALILGSFSPCIVSADNTETTEQSQETESTETTENTEATENTYTAPVLTVEEACAELTWNPNGDGSWIDRMNLPDYAIKFYELLEQNTTSDGFLVNPVQDKYLLTDPITEKTFYGIKIAETEKYSYSSLEGKETSAPSLCIRNVYRAFMKEHPENYWLQANAWCKEIWSTNKTNGKKVYYFMLKDDSYDIRKENYRDTAVLKAEIEKRDSYINNIMAGAASYTTEVEKIIYFNDWLTYHNSYNSIVSADKSKASTIAEECRTCIGALKGNSGENGPVCEGYAEAFKVLCNRAGITCVLSSGTATYTGIGHMWNLVRLDNIWYGVDVTWNDPTGGGINNENHKWLLAGSSTKANGKTFGGSRSTCPTDNFYINEPKISEKEYSTELLQSKNIFSPVPVEKDNVLDNTIKDGGLIYKITQTATDETPGAVSLVGAVSKTKKKVICPAKISAFDHWVTVAEDSEEQRDYEYLVTAIEPNAFLGNKKLQTLRIGKNVESIGKNAFYGCRKLKRVSVLSDKLTLSSMKKNTFTNVKKIKIVIPRQKKKLYKKIFKKAGLKKGKYITG